MNDEKLQEARILIVDDESSHVEVLTRVLEEHGYRHFHSATDPRDVLRLYGEFQPDLIILDWLMPEMGGMQVLEQLRAVIPAESCLPILVVTGAPDIEVKRQALASGATDFLFKPYDPSEIVLRVGNLLETRFLHCQLVATQADLLHKEREFLAALLENLQEGIVACDAHGVLTLFNRATREFHGLSAEACPAEDWAEHFDLYQADGTTPMKTAEIPLFRALQGETVRDAEMVIAPRRGGQRRTLLASGKAIFDARGEKLGAVVAMHDITERKRAEDQLRASEERFRSVTESVGDGIISGDAGSRIIFWNHAAELLFGHRAEEVLGQPLTLIMPERYHAMHLAGMTRYFASGETHVIGRTIEIEGLRKDGSEFPIELTISTWKTSDGTFFTGIIRDITERQQTQAALLSAHADLELRVQERTAALRESEERFRQLTETIKDVFWLSSPDGHQIIYASPAYEQLWGRSRERLVANPWEWAEAIHPEDRERVRLAFHEKGASGGYAEEYRILRPDGTLRWIKDRAFPVRDDTGEVYRIAGVAQDITARKYAEQESRLRVAQQAAIVALGERALLRTELHALFDETVALAATTLGVESAKILELQPDKQSLLLRAGVGWKEGVVGRSSLGVGKESQAGFTLLTNEPVIAEDLRTETRFSAPPLWYEHGVISAMTVIIGAPAQPYGVLGACSQKQRIFTADDASFLQAIANMLAAAIERTSVETTLHEAKEEAEKANRAKSEFLSRMSHELRTPLNAILGFAQVLEMNPLEGQPRNCVAHILKAGSHLLSLINEVLDLSGIEAGRVTFSIEAVRVQDVVRECLDLVRPLAVPRGLRLDSPEDDPSDAHVLADRQRLKQVVLNLLANAVKYNRDGGSAKVSWQEQGPDRLRISVEDTGPGVAADKLGLLFSPFERLGAELTATEGSGLGLALSKNLIEAMGGVIGVESVAGRGSTFWIELPRSSSPLARVQATGVPAGFGAAGASGTILYIEDNLSNLTLIEYLFSQRPQLRLLTAMQGRLGIELAREHRPDLILLDLHLPDMMGDEVLAGLKSDPQTRNIPIAMLTADATPAQEKRLLAAGADDYLTKPIDVARLLHVIEKTLGRRETDDRKAEEHGNY